MTVIDGELFDRTSLVRTLNMQQLITIMTESIFVCDQIELKKAQLFVHLHSTLVVRVVVTGDNQATGSDWPELDVLLNQTQASFFYNNVFVSW